ncbi:MAG TPA: DUF167 domain-containing protein [Deinococcales bacterium]|nr:DUF167 domain-containing protein [Deinococcales bacterium]
MRFHIWVQPGARRTERAGRHGDDPKLRVAAPPREGAANDALIAYLAAELRLPRSSVRIAAGESSRRKLVEVPDEADARLKDLLAAWR